MLLVVCLFDNHLSLVRERTRTERVFRAPCSSFQMTGSSVQVSMAFSFFFSPLICLPAHVAGGGMRRDQCSGDSGGPLVIANKLVGLVSWAAYYSRGCGFT